jgi:hypothetical protein
VHGNGRGEAADASPNDRNSGALCHRISIVSHESG